MIRFAFWGFTNPVLSDIIRPVPGYLARWCSRLARQPVTLEVDGSSPFRVAKKEATPKGWLPFWQFQKNGLEKQIQQPVLPEERKCQECIIGK